MEKSAGEEIASEGARSQISEANTDPRNEKTDDNSKEFQPVEKKRRENSLISQEPAKEQLKVATNNFLSQLSSTRLLEADIVSLGHVVLIALERKHKDAGYEGNFWEKISTRISEQHSNDDSSRQHQVSTGSSEVLSENHPVQFLELCSNADPASNDSSKQHQISTGSCEVLTENQQRTVIQNLLLSLGIISKKWTPEDSFHAKFTVEGAEDNIRTRALLVVLSSF